MSAHVARALRRLVPFRGWRSVVNRLVPDHSGPFVVRNRDALFAGDIGSYIDRQVFLFGGYEISEIECFLSCIPAGRRRTILDIGANVGTHSLAFAGSFTHVEAFEPNPMLWQQFEWNMRLNGFTNVRLHRLGLADRDSELTLHLIDKPNYGLGTFSTEEQYDLPLRAIATCPIRHAGSYLSEIESGPIDAVKIDVQGFEPEVLSGLGKILERDRPIIWCEIGGGTLTKMASTQALATRIPYRFRCLRLVRRYRWATDSVALQERTGELAAGDYVLIPI